MNLVTRTWKKLLYLLITGSTSVFIAACYGMPAGFADLGDWTVRVHDENDEPVPGLKVTLLHYPGENEPPDTLEVTATDSLGSVTTRLITYDRSAPQHHDAVIEDVDGAENGGSFADTTVVWWAGAQETAVRLRRLP